jgi:DNA-binding response OmpR family regulator
MNKLSILVIDDDPACLRMISTKALDGSKYQVLTASSCAEGIRLAAARRPDCILLDYHLKDGSAADVCKAIRSDENIKKTPIIVISGDPTRNIEAEEDCQADRFIAKGVPLAEYDAAIQSLLRRVAWDRGIIEKGDLRLCGSDCQVYRNVKSIGQLSPEQFRLFALLVDKSPKFVSEDDIKRCVFGKNPAGMGSGAVYVLAHRLRMKLGAQLARRIKNKKRAGWIYLEPGTRRGIARSKECAAE